MNSPSYNRLKSRCKGFPRKLRMMLEAFCLIYDASEGECEAFRKVALAGVSVLMDQMKKGK